MADIESQHHAAGWKLNEDNEGMRKSAEKNCATYCVSQKIFPAAVCSRSCAADIFVSRLAIVEKQKQIVCGIYMQREETFRRIGVVCLRFRGLFLFTVE